MFDLSAHCIHSSTQLEISGLQSLSAFPDIWTTDTMKRKLCHGSLFPSVFVQLESRDLVLLIPLAFYLQLLLIRNTPTVVGSRW